jgi:hypothetical protein
MDQFQEFLDTLRHTQVAAPSIEIIFLLALLAICLVFRATRIGLLVAYLFVYRWGWLFIAQTFGQEANTYLSGYAVFGVLVIALTVISMVRASGDR